MTASADEPRDPANDSAAAELDGAQYGARPDDPTDVARSEDLVGVVPNDTTPQKVPASERAATPAFDAPTEALHSDEIVDEANPGAQTVISKKPVAAPEEFYRSMPLGELAAMLEGRELDHFAVEQMIGGGGMGAVFRGRDMRLDRVVAIKVIPSSRRDAETLRRFRQEAQAAARLDHPNIARVYYVGEAERWNYIVFEFIDGVNIRDLVDMEGPLSIDDAVYYTRQVSEALEHARMRDVVHRDIKPSNILVTATGHVKVVDMGLARDTSMDKSTGDETASGITLGTFDYISPEQARNPRDADTRSDLYSLGCSLFFMLTGTPPFPDGTALQKLLNHGSQAPPDPRGWRDDMSDRLCDIVFRLMAKRPSQRYQKPADLVNDLVLLAEAEGLPRSQSPGTFMFTPTVVQRSLLETNLPWIVALAFLLGSALWWQGIEASTGMTQLPRITAVSGIKSGEPDEADTDSATNVEAPPSSENDSEGLPEVSTERNEGDVVAETILPTEVVVVAAQQPADVAPIQWERSLSDALRRVMEDSSIREVEVRGSASLNEHVELRGRSITIRGKNRDAYDTATLQVSLADVSDASSCLMEVTDGQLALVGLKIVAEPNPGVQQHGFVKLAGGESGLRIQGCEVNVLRQSRQQLPSRLAPPLFSVVRIAEEVVPTQLGPVAPVFIGRGGAVGALRETALSLGDAPAPYPVAPSGRMFGDMSSSEIADQDAVALNVGDVRRRVEIDDSTVRLHGSLVSLEDLKRRENLELIVRQSLVVSNREVLFARATNSQGNPRFIRADLDTSTFVSPTGFATFTYEGTGNPQLGLNRKSSSCAFWSAPDIGHLNLVGARRQSLLGNFVLLDFQGQSNAYDRNIEDICQSYSGVTQTAKFGFQEAGQDGWFAERRSEFQVAWPMNLASVDFDAPDELLLIGVQTVSVSEGSFRPGLQPPGSSERSSL